jgi:hypothetical protein
MSAESWALLKVRLEALRDTIAWLAGAALVVGAVGAYAAVQDLREFRGPGQPTIQWHRYVGAVISGAGIPLIVSSVMVALVVLLTAGAYVASVSSDDASDENAVDDEGESTLADLG